MPRPDRSAAVKSAAAPAGPSKILIGAVVVVALVIVGGIAWLRTDPFTSLDAVGSKSALAEGAGVQVYADKAKQGAPTVDVYEDFQCPFCAQLEKNNGAAMVAAASRGDIRLRVHVLSFLDKNLDNDSSARAANASFCADDAGRFPQFHSAVFAAQPEQEGAGYTDDALRAAATRAGITGAALTTFTTCMKDNTYGGYVKDTQKASEKADVNGTPTVKVNGKALDNDATQKLINQPNSFASVLAAAA